MGFGPAAHSFDLNSRQWNVAHLKSYIDNLANDRLSFEKEILTDKDKFNEYIMTNLRTMWGIQEEKMQLQFPDFSKTVRPKLAPFLENGVGGLSKRPDQADRKRMVGFGRCVQ